MFIANPRRRTGLALALLALWAVELVACGTPVTPGAPTPPGGAIKVSNTAADELEKNVRNQILAPSRREFALTITSEQLTSYATLHNTSIPLEKPQIWFAGGRAYVRGTFTALCLWRPDILVVAAPRLAGRRLDANIIQIYVGSLGVPPDWLPTISQSIRDSIEDANLDLDFDRLDVSDGSLVILGSKRAN